MNDYLYFCVIGLALTQLKFFGVIQNVHIFGFVFSLDNWVMAQIATPT